MQRAQPELWTGREVARLLALVESERRYYQEIVAAVPIGLVAVSSDLSIVSSNRAVRRIVNSNGDTPVRGHLNTIVPSSVIEKVQDVFKTGEPANDVVAEHMGRRLRVSATLIRNGDEERDSSALVSIEDVTGVVASSGEPASAPRPARTEPVELLKSLDAVLWAMDIPSQNFLMVTSTAQEVLGFPPEHWIQTPGFWADRIDAADREEVLKSYEDAIAQGERHSCEFRSKTAGGRSLWVRETARVLAGAGGEPKHLIGLTVDITERRQLEQQHVQAQRADAVSTLAGRLAHDLNNMLMIVTGYGEELAEQVQDNDALRSDVHEILAATGRIKALSDLLVTYTRRQQAPAETFDLSEMVRALEPALRQNAGASAEFHVDTGEQLLATAGRAQIEELLTTLIKRVGSQQANGTLTVTTAESRINEQLRGIDDVPRPGEYAVVSIEDTAGRLTSGAQIPLFESFLPTRDLPGETGAILSRAYALVRQWGGDISVTESPAGTRIAIYLPYAGQAEVKTPQSAPAAQPAAAPATILLAEDEDGIRALVKKILLRQGYTVLEAPNGEDAARLSSEYKGSIDLLITDVVMPHVGGRELAEKVRRQRGDIKVLYVSGYTQDASIYSANLPASTWFLQKPFRLGTLLDKVKEILSEAAAGS